MGSCTNCGTDLSVVRVSACCNHPMRPNLSECDFPADPIPALQSEIARLQAKVERLRGVVVKFGDGLRDAGMRLDTARNGALEDALEAVLHNPDKDDIDNVVWINERPYICEEAAYRKIEALKTTSP